MGQELIIIDGQVEIVLTADGVMELDSGRRELTLSLRLYDVTGKTVRKMELGHLTVGSYSQTERAIYWDGQTEIGEQVASHTVRVYRVQRRRP